MELISSNGASASDAIIIAFLALLTVGCIAGVIVFLCKNVGYEGKANNVGGLIAAILAGGFVLRIIFAMFIRGYRADYAVYTQMFDNLADNGLGKYYNGSASGILYPVVYFIYLIFGGIANSAGLTQYGLGTQFVIKLPLVIADLLAAVAIYKIAAKYFNGRVALVLMAFVALCPIFFIGSCLWATPITFTVTFACWACYYLAKKNYSATIAFATAAAFSSIEGIYIFPVVCVFSAYHFVRVVRMVRADGVSLRKVWSADYRAAITIPVGFVLSLLGAYFIGLFMIAPRNAGFFSYIYNFTLAPLGQWKLFTQNGLSVYTVFGRNGVSAGPRFPTWLFATLFAAIIITVVSVVYFTKRNRATMVMLAAFCSMTMHVYYPSSTAVGLQSTLLLLVAAYALVKDKRILIVLFASGIAYLANMLAVLGGLGQMNNLNDYGLQSGSINSAAAVACSVIAVLAHLYYTIVTISVGMTGQKKLLSPVNGTLESFVEFFKIKKG